MADADPSTVADVPALLAEIESLNQRHDAVVRLAQDELGRADQTITELRAQNAHYAQRIANTSASMQNALDAAMGPVLERLHRLLAITYASPDGAEYEHIPGHTQYAGDQHCPACWAAVIRATLGVPNG